MPVEYKDVNVLVAAKQRVSAVFDEFEHVIVSVSGGKDSTVIYHLAVEEAQRRGRRMSLFFLDQEAEYESTVEIMARWMRDPRIDPLWYQVPIRMTNATSHNEYFLRAWWPGERWLREKDPIAIHSIDEEYHRRFYDFFKWHETKADVSTAYLVGLRSKESFNRFRAVTKRPGFKGWSWSTKTKSKLVFRAYPIYDWTFGDVWKYISDNELPYNRHYDRMFAKYGVNMSRMRVSTLMHEKSFRCLGDLQEFEPELFDRLVDRLGGVHAAALYGKEKHIYDAKQLPERFASWREFRDYLLDTTPIDKIDRFRSRFEGQADDEDVHRQQVKQILINDWENSVPVSSPRGVKKADLRARWWDVL